MKDLADIPAGTPIIYPPKSKPVSLAAMVGRANIIMAIFHGQWPSEN